MKATTMTYLKIGAVVALIGGIALVSCTEERPPIISQTDDINQFAISVLNDLQPISIAEEREYCGYIFETEDGRLAATAARPGTESLNRYSAPPPTTAITVTSPLIRTSLTIQSGPFSPNRTRSTPKARA